MCCPEEWKREMISSKPLSIGQYLLNRIKDYGVSHLFWEGAELVEADVDSLLVEEAVNLWGVKKAPLEDIL